MPEPYGTDELLCSVISREIGDGDVLLEGIGTFLPSVAYELARRQHAPNALTFTPAGTVFRARSLVAALTTHEQAAIEAGLRRVTYGEIWQQYLSPYIGRESPLWKEFVRPAQVDCWGNTNNVVIGSYDKPDVRLPGAVGIPDGTSLERAIYLYAPRHSPRVLRSRCDFVSGLGWRRPDKERLDEKIGRSKMLVTDLCVIRFEPQEGALLHSVHPGVRVEDVRAATGFELIVRDVEETEPPSDEQLELMRGELDPLGLRRLELYPGRARRSALRRALAGEEIPDPTRSHV